MTLKRIVSALTWALAAVALPAQVPPQGPPPPAAGPGPIGNPVRTFIEKNCQACHNASFPSGGVDLRQLISSTDTLTNQRTTWDTVVSMIQTGQMPPQGAPKPAQADVSAVIAAIGQELANAKPAAKPAPPPPAPPVDDWLTYGYDGERTGWNRAEKALNKDNVRHLGLVWRLQLDSKPNTINRYSSMTDPLVVQNVAVRQGPQQATVMKTLVFVASADNTVYAIDAEKGTPVWQRSFPNAEKPPQAASGICPNNLNATPVIDKAKSTIYFLANDGKLRGLGLSDGEDKFVATALVPPYSRNFSLNLIDGMIYTSTARGCGGAVSEIAGIDVASPDHPVAHFYTSTGKASGPWGRGGIVKSPFGVLAQDADGAYDPASGRWGNTILGFNKNVRLTDSYTPANEQYINARDFDLGSSSPVVFPFDKWTLVATAGKEGVIYLLDAMHLGGQDHRTPLFLSPRYSNDAMTFGYNGMWSVMSTYVDDRGQRWLLAPFYGPAAKDTAGTFKIQHGPTVNGTLMAFKVVLKEGNPVLEPEWMSADLDLPGPAVVANGLIYILANGDRAGAALGGRGGPGGGRGGPGGPGGGRGGPGGPGGFGGRGGRGGAGRTLPITEVNPNEPGFEKDAAWRASQLRPFAEGGQQNGTRYSGGRDTTHAVLYVLDAATGEELYSSGDTIDSWNHYGGVVLSGGRLYLSSYDDRVYAFGLPAKK